jgi:DNA-directed RNA polymerase specialized sigma24 family protein
LRDRRIAIWKRSGFSSQYIGEQLEMSASSVDTAYSRVCQRLRRIFGPRPLDGVFKRH